MKLLGVKLLLISSVCVCLAGCSGGGSQSDSSDDANQADTAAHGESAHDHSSHAAHPEHGPHEGELIELGNEAFHAEMKHENDRLAIYVLDSTATQSVPIDAAMLTISLKLDGNVKSFDLPASPDEGDPENQSSRFLSADTTLHEWLDGGAEGALTLEIAGKSYTGNVAHDHSGHDHSGHGH